VRKWMEKNKLKKYRREKKMIAQYFVFVVKYLMNFFFFCGYW